MLSVFVFAVSFACGLAAGAILFGGRKKCEHCDRTYDDPPYDDSSGSVS